MKRNLIILNVAVFVVVLLLKIIFTLFGLGGLGTFVSWLEVPSNLHTLLFQPWSVVTYMFLHYDITHILFNMLWLYWLGDLFLQVYPQRNLVSLYVLGGLTGAVAFVGAYNIFPYFENVVYNSYLLGASASVLAIMGALLYRMPNYEIRLFLFGSIRFKYMAIVIIGLDILFMLDNPGQHFAHLGGAVGGIYFAYMYSKGRDITRWINVVIDFFVTLFRPVVEWCTDFCRRVGKGRKPKMKINNYGSSGHSRDYKDNLRHKAEEADIDTILEKIKKNGYGSLSADEKRKLFDASRK